MSTLQKELATFSRVIILLFNRATIYQSDHPYVKQTIEQFTAAIQQLLKSLSPLVFILNGDQFFIDDEPLPPGTQVGRIAGYFNKTGIQSISFESGLEMKEVKTFLDVFTSLDANPNAEAMKKALVARGVKHVKINRVFFKKVNQDHEIVSREALKELMPKLSGDTDTESKRLFVDMILERLLAEELKETLTIENLLKNPAALSKKMTDTDLVANSSGKLEGGHPGLVLMHQLEILGSELQNNSYEETNLEEVAGALFEMKKRLLGCMQAQKSLNVVYSNEEAILDKVDEITDNVILRIIKDEYKAGKTSIARLAQILPRLLPDAAELKRLLPKIRSVLMEEGMSLLEYLHLAEELGKELQSEGLVNILQESAELIGIDSEILVEEIQKNPVQASELLYLAAEIRKGSGDGQKLSDLLVDYVDRLGLKASSDISPDGKGGEKGLREALSSMESGIVKRLKSMDVKDNLIDQLEKRFNDRIDEILEKYKMEWIHSHSTGARDSRNELSVLELLEQTAVEGDELYEILEIIKRKVAADEIDKDNFAQIYSEITNQQAIHAREIKEKMPEGVLEAPVMTAFIEKEITRSRRYEMPFSMLCFSIVKAAPKSTAPTAKISHSRFIASVLQAISKTVRASDIIGELGKNRMVVLLPMTSGSNARIALKKCLKNLHSNPVEVDGTRFDIKVAGVSTAYDIARAIDSVTFIQSLLNELAQMEKRILNLQIYF